MNTKPFNFWCECAIFYVTVATLISSHVKITCHFHVWRYHVFARKLTWYFTAVYIKKKVAIKPSTIGGARSPHLIYSLKSASYDMWLRYTVPYFTNPEFQEIAENVIWDLCTKFSIYCKLYLTLPLFWSQCLRCEQDIDQFRRSSLQNFFFSLTKSLKRYWQHFAWSFI